MECSPEAGKQDFFSLKSRITTETNYLSSVVNLMLQQIMSEAHPFSNWGSSSFKYEGIMYSNLEQVGWEP